MLKGLLLRGFFKGIFQNRWVDGCRIKMDQKVDLSKITVDLVVSIEKKRLKWNRIIDTFRIL